MEKIGGYFADALQPYLFFPVFLFAHPREGLFSEMLDVLGHEASKDVSHWRGGRFRKPQKMLVMSTDDGKVIGDLPIAAGVDATRWEANQVSLALAKVSSRKITPHRVA